METDIEVLPWNRVMFERRMVFYGLTLCGVLYATVFGWMWLGLQGAMGGWLGSLLVTLILFPFVALLLHYVIVPIGVIGGTLIAGLLSLDDYLRRPTRTSKPVKPAVVLPRETPGVRSRTFGWSDPSSLSEPRTAPDVEQAGIDRT